MNAPKSIFTSRTALANGLVAIAGAVGSFVPGVSEFLSSHASGIMAGLGIANIGLRFITRQRVVLFAD